MDSDVDQYCLRWKYHHSNLQYMFAQLLESKSLCDVTLACEGKTLRVHKIILSACSAYFDSIFSKYEENDPIVIIEGVKFEDVNTLVEFMYRGEITVDKARLNDLIETAEELQVKGLAAVSWRSSGEGWYSVDTEINDVDPNLPFLNKSSVERVHPSHDDEVPVVSSLNIKRKLPSVVHSDVNVPNSNTHTVYKKVKIESPSCKNSIKEEVIPTTECLVTREPVVNKVPVPNVNKVNKIVEGEDLSGIITMNEHIDKGGWRPHFWELNTTKRVMEAIKNKRIEMKHAAELLGVTYGTLYGRYREVHGYLKQPQREFWHDVRFADILGKLKRKEISLFKAAELMNVTATLLANHLAKLDESNARYEYQDPDIKTYSKQKKPDEEPLRQRNDENSKLKQQLSDEKSKFPEDTVKLKKSDSSFNLGNEEVQIKKENIESVLREELGKAIKIQKVECDPSNQESFNDGIDARDLSSDVRHEDTNKSDSSNLIEPKKEFQNNETDAENDEGKNVEFSTEVKNTTSTSVTAGPPPSNSSEPKQEISH